MPQVIDIFNFLKEFNMLKNPVITEIKKQKWYYDLSEVPEIDEIESVFQGSSTDESMYLKVIKPSLEPCPDPGEDLLEWIDGDWEDISKEVVSHKKMISREIQDEEGNISHIDELYEDDRDRVELFNKWVLQRQQWIELQLPRKKGLLLYNNLFRLYSDIKKESESVELIIGDGIISWNVDGRIIDHPVLLQRVELEFEPNKPMFIVRCHEIKTEIYTAMLRVISSVNKNMLTDILQEVEQKNYCLHDFENTESLFQQLSHIIDESGEFVKDISKRNSHAQITSKPVLFLRKRTLGYAEFLDGIIDEIREDVDITLPKFFNTMIGNHAEDQEEITKDKEWNHDGIDKDILLTLPANNEQLKIIKYLEKYGAVLVQGPPGTGKTHTIANLIGHLLSQGNSVLVTSHTEKALTVLKEKVYKDPTNSDINLQNLCISLLSSRSQKDEMDTAINEIAVKRSTLQLDDSKKLISRLKREREGLIDKSQSKFEELVEVRSLEYKDIVYDSETIKPIDAAKFIKSNEEELNIIPGNTSDDTVGFPLSSEEITFLYWSNNIVTQNKEELFEIELPEFANLLEPNYYEELINSINRLKVENKIYQPSLAFNNKMTTYDCEELINEANILVEELNGFSEMQKHIFESTVHDPVYEEQWESVLVDADSLLSSNALIKKIEFEYDFEYDSSLLNIDNLNYLREIIDTGKEVPVTKIHAILNRSWSMLKNGITNDGKAIQKHNEYEAIYEIFRYELDKQNLVKKANKLLADTEFQIDANDKLIEIKVAQNIEYLLKAVKWNKEQWQGFCDRLEGFLLDHNHWDDINKISLTKPIEWIKDFMELNVITELIHKKNEISINNKNNEYEKFVSLLETYKNQHELLDKMIESVKNFKPEIYSSVYRILQEMEEEFTTIQKRKSIIYKINKLAPEWATEIKNRNRIHGLSEPPKKLTDAWKWRQLVNQIERINSYDPNKIQAEINAINKEILKNARSLAYECAWLNKINNISSEQMQAIEGWRSTIKQIGKGTGKRAPALRKKARELMPDCQTAIPVWIMPLSTVVENFNPRKNKFDVVIIDEASQSDILALSALYLGRKIIIVGDNEQVSPYNVGINSDELGGLIDMHLQDIPNNHLFNGETSLYDIAQTVGFKPLMLTEHFRCLPEIIEFSNKLSYNGRIKPLRDASGVKIKPPVVECRVKNGVKDSNKVNKKEAKHVASLVCAMVEDPSYKGKSIGVISMQGDKQAYEIDRIIQSNIDPVEYEKRRIQCGTSPQFQGDERDVIILSLVDSPNELGGPIRLLSEDGNNDRTRKRYNVAASRAKDQMWVVHSLNPEIDLKPDDIRLRLILHAQNPLSVYEDNRLNHAESPFEEEVMKYLINKGYNVIPQMRVGSYRIDMVVEDEDNRMAIECDGEKWHTSEDLPNDLKRQAILERLGWRFIRIRGSLFYRNSEEAMLDVFEELGKNGINPNYNKSDVSVSPKNIDENQILRRVKNRALEIRMEWEPDNNRENTPLEEELDEEDNESTSDLKTHLDFEILTKESDSYIPRQDELSRDSKEHDGNNELDETIGEKVEETKVIKMDEEQRLSKKDTTTSPVFDFSKNNSNYDIKEKKQGNKSGSKSETRKSKVNSTKDKKTKENPNDGVKAPLFDFTK